MQHTFHIPVLGLGYSIDTPLKVARYGISSVVSIVDDELTERMREYHSLNNQLEYVPILKSAPDYRAHRITAYLNLLQKLVNHQSASIRQEPFTEGSDSSKYFELLPESAPLKQRYQYMLKTGNTAEKTCIEKELRMQMLPGRIDVNIMSKVDKANFNKLGENLGDIYTDALAALRGFANSDLQSSVIISAGLNPRLYSYLESFPDFFPDQDGFTRKKVILKVSDFRSAHIQAKVLAKKGIWVFEFRVESGLNCGGHAFATDGLLLGPILEEFRRKREVLKNELTQICSAALEAKGLVPDTDTQQRITVQGGIGTHEEDLFLRNYYHLDGTGWGSPFLLVPEATNVDDETLGKLIHAKKDDYYLSNSSPLGVLFNSFRPSTSEQQRLERIKKRRPGSPCTKKFLCTNTEFTVEPICTASREYQKMKIEQVQAMDLAPEIVSEKINSITEKVCLCAGLCASAYIKNGMLNPRENHAVSICPGPNLAYFSSSYSLEEMIGHIYGRTDLLSTAFRPHIFINELSLYVDYLKKEISASMQAIDEKRSKYVTKFRDQLADGITYYRNLAAELGGSIPELTVYLNQSENELYRLLK